MWSGGVITKIMDNYQNSVAAFSGKQLLNCDPAVPRFCRIMEKKYTSMINLNISGQSGKVIFLSIKLVYLETRTINAISNSLTNIEKEEKYDQI